MPERTYTIKEGDTLSGIAERELGDASRWRLLYSVNSQAILMEQKRRGLWPRRRERWQENLPPQEELIFPGTELRIP